jgi:hypothetical protein
MRAHTHTHAHMHIHKQLRDAPTWEKLLRLALPRATQLSPWLINLLSGVPSSVWSALSASVQLTVLTTVTCAFEESDVALRGASLRGVGHLLMIPSLVVNNFRFLLDAHRLAERARLEPELAPNAFWVMGNLAHALVTCSADAAFAEPLDDLREMMLELLQVSVAAVGNAAQLHEKAHCSCLRILGKSSTLLTSEQCRPYLAPSISALVAALEYGDRPKVRWNAANAVAQLVGGNAASLLGQGERAALGSALVRVLASSGNFKERLSVLGALEQAAPPLLSAEELAMSLMHASLRQGPRDQELSPVYDSRLTSLLRATLNRVTDRESLRQRVTELCQQSPYHVHSLTDVVGPEHSCWLLSP